MFANLFSLPISDPILIFALAMAIFLVAPLVMERFKIPGLIGLIAAGALVGPNGLHLLDRGPAMVLLGTVGLIYLVFLAGVEIDLHGFRRQRPARRCPSRCNRFPRGPR
ncbi:MAG TPA: cation:proton antiporter [Gemmatimonadales bacterium]